MSRSYLGHAVTPSVAAAQQRYYGNVVFPAGVADVDPLGEDEQAFIRARDSFYLATVSESGWPYIQHRGGPAGFLRVLGPRQLGFADVRGNRQLLSTGNLAINDRVALFLMDYAQRSRLKIMGRARVVSAAEQPALAESLRVAGQPAVERCFLIEVVSHDWNCPKFITPRYTAADLEVVVMPLRRRISELEHALEQASRKP
jgi:predicted pyridoxine 5'-phosphate oxidase superfamily flavin-nucleotide-binding protein